ncbi:shikimate dehydrogenase family protein [Carboxylicivirga marina]|uniref:shikimate dehydrogenase family protein n=1 Tax=Carboxylicivirga marina TaxID=2800988 RepID=UPI0025995CB2|nr:shikimate dehydrogenase [uncultured Carboxylicivirga sp.]
MKTFGLIGFPLAQSFSQKYFTKKFKDENIDARYLNFEMEDITELPEVLNHHAYIAGLSITIPHKENVFKYLDDIDEAAKEIGACNIVKITWSNKNPKLTGFNTDVIGFTESIKPLIKEHHTRAIVLGTGGAAKAIVQGLKILGIESKYVSRKKNNDNLTYSELNKAILDEYTVIINCTPLGMYPNITECPDIPYALLSEKHLLYDLTYNPELTQFLKNGKEQGAAIKNGLEMLHLQAEAAWKIWNE